MDEHIRASVLITTYLVLVSGYGSHNLPAWLGSIHRASPALALLLIVQCFVRTLESDDAPSLWDWARMLAMLALFLADVILAIYGFPA